ncbi:rRNA-binding ribosome biosynthesis protein utp25 [Coemansia javaensis]|uniref:U3 small nucleolar RNA-associated protein 25 n=1 Tax=Coemansia javaensis TaxID=2761396 RepID=A0A9W8HL04_9FUNG|nr:rRNA-binding ribosome biosynthesis protein utp25 [Coemansia javaensis]
MPPAKKAKRGLSRKELQRLKEYGELDPLNSAADDRSLDDLISNALGRSGYGSFTGKLRRGRGAADGGRRGPARPNAQRGARPDAYTRLLKSLATGAAPGSQAAAVSDSDEDAPGSEPGDAGSEPHGSDEEMHETVDKAADKAADEEAREIDEVDDEDIESDAEAAGADAEAAAQSEAYAAHDYMEAHFADSDTELAHKKLAAVTNKEYEQIPLDDPVLGPCVVCNVAGAGVGRANPQPLKQKLAGPFHKLNGGRGLEGFQQRIFDWFDQYRDVVYAGRTAANEDELTTAYALHAMNHVMKAKDREHKNNAKLAKAHAAGADAGELRDRGFTRPRVLILVPFRNSAYRIIQKLLALTAAEQEMNSSRFAKEYGPDEDEERRHQANTRKPEDFRRTFAGNIDDSFRIGLQLHYRSVKLFADFYRADIIVASPIGLRMTTGAESGDRKDFDFLSSVEVVIADQCDVLLMQSWDHVAHVFRHLNLTPKKDHGCDFSRVRSWCLDGMARFRRQTIVLSEYMTPELQAVFNNDCRSIAGKVRTKPAYRGAVADVVAQVTQVFRLVPVRRLASLDDDRFAHFTEHALPEMEKAVLGGKHTVIFASSYFDFVRLRNHCRSKGYSFAAISEYSTKTEAMHARIKLNAGELEFILYSERAHFYHRYPIKGIHRLVFYGLPDRAPYYSELVNLMLTGNDGAAPPEQLTCTAFYTKYDQLKVERIVGTKLAPQLLAGTRSQFTFA